VFDLLAIDWGQKRIGMAFANSQTELVLPFDEFLGWTNFWEILEYQLKNRQVKTIIVGMPVNFELEKTKTSTQIESFLEDLENFLVEIENAKLPQIKTNLQTKNSQDLESLEAELNQKLEISQKNSQNELEKNAEKLEKDEINQDKTSLKLQELQENYENEVSNPETLKSETKENSENSKFKSKLETRSEMKQKKTEIVIINERNSTRDNKNFEIIQENDSKYGFRSWQKTNKRQNQKWQISKSNLNHLAAGQLLEWYFEQKNKSVD